MDVVLLIGRIHFAAIFIVSGSTVHLLKWREGVSYARANNVQAHGRPDRALRLTVKAPRRPAN